MEIVPGQVAMVAVALAWIGEIPKKINAGKATKVPPPAAEFIMPAIIPDRPKIAISVAVMIINIALFGLFIHNDTYETRNSFLFFSDRPYDPDFDDGLLLSCTISGDAFSYPG